VLWFGLAGGGVRLSGISGSLLLGIGTAMAYPTLLAAVGDVAAPGWRAGALAVYRFWRDLGFAAGALIGGIAADFIGQAGAIQGAGMLTLLSGVLVLGLLRETLVRVR
jgi:hypothetical protein